MSTFENKLEVIEEKLIALIGIKNMYQQKCEDLTEENNKLIKEIESLRSSMKIQTEQMGEIQSKSDQLEFTYQNDKAEIKEKIEKYIKNIDESIEWLKSI